jgi:hypothetical protein
MDKLRNTMSEYRQDIEDFAKIWDKALADGVFKDAPKTMPTSLDLSNDDGADFFGQHRNAEYDIDAPINEADARYWVELSKNAADRSSYFNPINEEREVSKEEAEKASKKLGSTFNPVYPNTIGKDQDMKVAKNWAMGGEELTKLEDLKSWASISPLPTSRTALCKSLLMILKSRSMT